MMFLSSIVYSNSSVQSPFFGLSSALIQALAVINWKTNTAKAAAKPTPERTFKSPSLPPSSSSSSASTLSVAICDGDENAVPKGLVGA